MDGLFASSNSRNKNYLFTFKVITNEGESEVCNWEVHTLRELYDCFKKEDLDCPVIRLIDIKQVPGNVSLDRYYSKTTE